MAITDRALKALRDVFGIDREQREKAESPSADALKYTPSSTYSIWGREDIGGLLSVSQNLMDRFSDYEAMNDYPDIRCFSGDMKVYVVDSTGVVIPTTFKKLATDGEGLQILAFDRKKKRMVKVTAEHPRLSGRNAPILKIALSNGSALRVTVDHKVLTKEKGYVEAKDLRKGDFLIGARAGFSVDQKSMLTVAQAGGVWVSADPKPDGVDNVYDVTTSTKNLLVNGVICHNSAFHYFANDSTQPNLDNGRVVWVTSPDEAIVDAADTLIKRRLRLEDDLFSIAYNLCQYGNDFEEVLVTERGVVGLNALAAPTVRRIEKNNGNLVGFVQDITGRFTANQEELRKMLAGNLEIPKHVATFEDWQVAHFRLRGTSRRSPYGASVAEGARWIWKRLVMLEDAVMIYKLTRAPARYAFYVDVTDVPSNRVESFLKRAKRDLKKKKMVNPNNNFLDMRYNPLCLSGETQIPQLDGSEKSLLEMVDAFERGEEQWVYSVDVNDGNKLVPGKVTWAGGTRKNAKLVKVTLDNGESIKVTPDHKMIRRSGEFAEAQTLKVGDSLMPYYRKRGDVSPAAPDYEMVYDPSSKGYKFVHRVVAEALGIKTGAPDSVIHHEDCNRLNNDPRNLTEMTWSDHKALHHKLSAAAAEKLTVYNKTDKARAETAETNRKYDKPALMRAAITPEIREKQKKAAAASKVEFWADPENKAQASKKMRYVYPSSFVAGIANIVLEEGPKVSAPTVVRIANERNLIEDLKEANPTKVGKLKNVHRAMLRRMSQSLGYESFKEFKNDPDTGYFMSKLGQSLQLPLDYQPAIPHNHKVAKIEWLEETEDTYTLTVDTAHTFAVSAGVFVKNSNDEDFFVAVREGRALSRVEVLSGPDYQNVDDVQYFQRKLHGALMVPRAYLGQDDAIQGRAILSNEDVRAARVSLQVQRELRNGIERLIRTDFAARGHSAPWDVPFEVVMTVPSNIYELAAMEVKNARADFAGRVQPYVSRQWILENVYKISDEEIKKIEQQRKAEAAKADRMGMDPSFGSFTGGKPPSPEEQAGMGQLPPEAMPPGLQAMQGGQAPPQGAEGAGPPTPPPAGAPQQAWRVYDQARRLEERRYRESRQNHQKLVDMVGSLKEENKDFARRMAESQAFMREFKEAALRSSRGQTMAVPSAAGRGYRGR